MAEIGNADYSLDASRNYFTNPANYTGFDLTRDKRRIIACADPRNEAREPGQRIKTAVQTAGAGAGEAVDRSVAYTALEQRYKGIDEALKEEIGQRGTTVLGAHFGCKFIDGMPVVLGEIANPSDFTMDDFNRSLRDYNIAEDINPIMPALLDAAKVHLEHVTENGVTHNLVETIGAHYPEHANVASMIGPNISQIYVTNEHPLVGLDRDSKAKLRSDGVDVQGYHESRRAAFEDIATSYNLSRIERTYRVGAFMLRSAATRTVLGSLQPDMEFYKVTQGNGLSGLYIAQQESL